MIRETRKLEVTVRNNDVAKFMTRGDRLTKLLHYSKRPGPRLPEKTRESKIASHNTEFTRIQKESENEAS